MKLAVAALVVCALATPGEAEIRRTIAGSLQLDYLAVPTEQAPRQFTLDGATLELSLKMSVDFSEHASATVKACFACHGFEAASAFIGLRAADELAVKAGRLIPAFGSFPQRHDPANHHTSDKPLPYDMGRMLHRTEWNEGVLPSPWVDNGIEVGGTHFFEDGRVDYAAYVLSGPKSESPMATDFDFVLSRTPYYTDNNSQPVAGARLAGALDIDDATTFELGASGMAGHYDTEGKLAFWIAGVDVAAKLAALTLRAEYLVRRTETSDSGAFLKHGYFGEGELALGRVELIARFDGLYRKGAATPALADRATLERATLAAAVRVVADVRVKTSVEYYWFSDFDDELAVHLGVATPF